MATVLKKEKVEIEKVKTGKKSTVNKVVHADNTVSLKKIGEEKIYADVFNEPRNSALTAQYIRTYLANQRDGNAKTKTRGEVSGSGKKPWKQKGTGRSRVGSIRTPVWRHGGVSHGPVLKDWSLKMPKKMKAKAFLIAISDKVLKSRAFFLEEFKINEGRTKEVLALTKSWNLHGKLVLIVDQKNDNLQKGAANLSDVLVVNYRSLNTYQLLWANAVVFEKSVLDKILENYGKH
jgi:large subunit ribosomal protein L4